MSSQRLLRGVTAGHTVRSIGLLVVLLIVALVVIGLVLLSPLVLAAVDPNGNADWQRLANIAETYGAVSAVLALLALGGVSISLVFQAREIKAARKQALRMGHNELMRMAIEDPMYLRVLGPSRFSDDAQRRQNLFANLLVSHWQASYEMGDMTDVRLRVAAEPFFMGEPGRRFWRLARDARMRTSTDRLTRRFHEILDEEYRKATRPSGEEPARMEPVQNEPDQGTPEQDA